MSEAVYFLLRHSPAGKRGQWAGDDRLRPLDDKGRKQADRIAVALAEYSIERVCSSPYLRCVQTVQPLCDRLGIELQIVPALAEGSSEQEVRAFLHEAGARTLACTHGDVVQMLVGIGEPMKKGSLWLLDDHLDPVDYKGVPGRE